MKKLNYCKYALIATFSIAISLISCKKFIEVKPPATSVNEGNVFKFDGSAISAVIGIYTQMSNTQFAGDLALYPELSADNLKLLNLENASQRAYYQNDLQPNDAGSIPNFWNLIYPKIFQCNAAITGLLKSTTLTPSVKQNLLGQAYFLRGFFYFYLTSFYGEVPLALGTDYIENSHLSRSSIDKVYEQIVSDLLKARELLPTSYLRGDMINVFAPGQEERYLPNRFAATALLARVYLHQKNWVEAESMATEVINQTSLYSISTPLNEVFLKNSSETIWSLQPVTGDWNTSEAEIFTLQDGDPISMGVRSMYLSEDFMKMIQVGDQRRSAWINVRSYDNESYPYPAKYKALPFTPLTEYSVLLRLAEQYMIRAEARVEQNLTSEAISDLNAIRDRAIDKTEPDESFRLKLWPTNLSREDAVSALMYEQRIEFFAEHGDRWLNLKRRETLNEVLTKYAPEKSTLWSSYKSLYPIPSVEIERNRSLIQNPGVTLPDFEPVC